MWLGCAYRKLHRKQWRYKEAKNKRHLQTATQPNKVVSTDQLISPTPGFIPVHRGKPTNKQYLGATVFVDHFSDFAYVNLTKELTAKLTVKSKQSFDRLEHSYCKLQHHN